MFTIAQLSRRRCVLCHVEGSRSQTFFVCFRDLFRQGLKDFKKKMSSLSKVDIYATRRLNGLCRFAKKIRKRTK